MPQDNIFKFVSVRRPDSSALRSGGALEALVASHDGTTSFETQFEAEKSSSSGASIDHILEETAKAFQKSSQYYRSDKSAWKPFLKFSSDIASILSMLLHNPEPGWLEAQLKPFIEEATESPSSGSVVTSFISSADYATLADQLWSSYYSLVFWPYDRVAEVGEIQDWIRLFHLLDKMSKPDQFKQRALVINRVRPSIPKSLFELNSLGTESPAPVPPAHPAPPTPGPSGRRTRIRVTEDDIGALRDAHGAVDEVFKGKTGSLGGALRR